MSWNAPIHWENNQLITADDLNHQIEENLKFLYPPSAARVYRTSARTIGDTTWIKVGFENERFDTEDIHDNVTNNERLICKTAGRYLIFGHAGLSANSTGLRKIRIYLNNTTGLAEQSVVGSSITTVMSIATVYELAVDDYVELEVYQNSTSTLSLSIGPNYSPEFGMIRVG